MLFKRCPDCDSENPEGAEFCLECGARMEPLAPPAAAPAAPVAPDRTPDEQPPTPPVAEEDEFEEPEREAAAPASPSSLFGERYKVIETIGSGRLGSAFKVFDKALERELALKSFGPEIARDADAFAGFSRELRAERAVVHKNIARLFELNTAKGVPFITMEFVAGRNLRAQMAERGGRLPVDQAVGLARQLSKALAEIHRRGILHLDLRPGQILVDAEGTPKILDLGVTRWLRSKGLIPHVPDGEAARYASPEQLEGRISDQRADIYALGVVLYELLTGVTPFAAAQAEEGREPEPRRAARNPKELNPTVKAELGLIILRCLEADRDKRYHDAADLARDLERIEDGQAPGRPAEPAAAAQPEEKARPAAPAERAASQAEPPARASNVKVRAKRLRRAFKLPQIPRKFVLVGSIVLGAMVLCAVVVRLAWHSGRTATSEPRPDKIVLVVLPFAEAGGSGSRGYIGEGLAETLIAHLNRLPGVIVPGAASSLSARTPGTNVRQTALALKANYVLGGSFEWTEKKLRITARLDGAADGSKAWEQQFEQPTPEFFHAVEAVASGAAAALKLKTRTDGVTVPVGVRPVIPEACEFYFQGRELARKGGKDNLEKAVECFQKAADKDPRWGSAWADMAGACIELGLAAAWSPDKAFPRARQAVIKAMELEPKSAGTRLAFGLLKWLSEWEYAGAEAEFKEAIRISPEEPEIRRFYSLFLSSQGRHDEAVSEMRTAQTLDPLSAKANAGVGEVLYYARLYEQAAEELDKARETDPQAPEVFEHLGLVELQMSDFPRSLEMFRQAAFAGGNQLALSLRAAFVLARLGARQEVGKVLTEALRQSRETYVSPVGLASVYAGLLEKEQAFACLEKAVDEKDASLVFLKVSPLFDSIRGDPQFATLLRKIGL